MKFQSFEGGPFTSWETLMQQAALFAAGIGRSRVVNITAVATGPNGSYGLVTVWYWAE